MSNVLDLHGVRHDDVDMKVENFVLTNQNILPLKIMCGNSQRMQEIAGNTLDRIDVQYSTEWNGNILIFKI
jgi:hypothetical protein